MDMLRKSITSALCFLEVSEIVMRRRGIKIIDVFSHNSYITYVLETVMV